MINDVPATPLASSESSLQRLHPSARKVWTIKILLFGAILVFVSLIYDAASFFADDPALPTGVATISAVLFSVLLGLVVPRLRYRFWRYSLQGEELFLRRGIINRVSTVVPLRRIQHLDVSQDIIEREFELGKLIVHTAGTRSSDVVLPGLAFEEAERLRDELKNYILEDTI